MKHTMTLMLAVTLLTGNSLRAQQSDQSFLDSFREWVTHIAENSDDVRLLTDNSLIGQQIDQLFFDSFKEWVTQITENLDEVRLLTDNSLIGQSTGDSVFDALHDWITEIAIDLDLLAIYAAKEYSDDGDTLVAAQAEAYTDNAVEGIDLTTMPKVSSLAEDLEVGDFIWFIPDATSMPSEWLTNPSGSFPWIVTEISSDKQYASVVTASNAYDNPDNFFIQRVKISGDSKSYIYVISEAELAHINYGTEGQAIFLALQDAYDSGMFNIVGTEFFINFNSPLRDIDVIYPSIDEPFFIGETDLGSKVYINAYTHGVEVTSAGISDKLHKQQHY